MYRALFAADIHASNTLPYAQRNPETLISDRLIDTIGVLDAMCEYACEHSIKPIWILGDLVDKRLIDAVTLKTVVHSLVEMKRLHDIYLVPGNHEAYDAKARHFVLDAFGDLGIWVAPGRGDLLAFDDFQFAALPYQPDELATAQLEEWAAVAKKEPIILLLHQSIKGGQVGDWVCPDGLDVELLEPFSSTMSGHFHTPQELFTTANAPQELAPVGRYLGAGLQHNFGDRGEVRGFWDVQIDGKGAIHSCVLVPVNSPRFHELIYPSKGFEAQAAEIQPDDYVRVRCRGSEAGMKTRMRQMVEYCDHLIAEKLVRYAKPVAEPEAKTKAKSRLSGEGRTWTETVGAYLDVCDVHSLNRNRLESLGNDLINEAEG